MRVVGFASVALSVSLFLNSQAVSAQDYDIEAFHTKWFWTRPKEGFYNVEAGLKASWNTNSTSSDFHGNRIFALGDLNNDKLNDLVTVSDD